MKVNEEQVNGVIDGLLMAEVVGDDLNQGRYLIITDNTGSHLNQYPYVRGEK